MNAFTAAYSILLLTLVYAGNDEDNPDEQKLPYLQKLLDRFLNELGESGRQDDSREEEETTAETSESTVTMGEPATEKVK